MMPLFSILSPLENVMKSILDFFHGSVGLPWAWSIVALTVLVRIVLVPLTVRQIHSMQSLQAHAPEMKAIQQKYKGDRTKLNEELMKFYKENNINPAASCLPLLAQFPVFIALYFTLKNNTKHITGSWLHVVPNISDKGDGALVGLRAARDLRGLAGRVDVLHGRDDGQDAAEDHDGPAARLPDGRLALPDGADPLLDDDQPLDGRAGARHAAARAEAPAPKLPARRRPEAELAHAAEGREHGRQRRRCRGRPPEAPPAAPRRVKRKKGGARR